MDVGTFARKLRASKAMRHQIPHSVPVTLTAPRDALGTDDYGLKQPLPSGRRRSPYIHLHRMDGEWARPDWRAATSEALFAARWEESGLGADSSTRSRADFVTTSSFAPASVPTVDDFAQMAVDDDLSDRTSPPDFVWLSEADFERYLDKLRDLRPAFRAFCAARRNGSDPADKGKARAASGDADDVDADDDLEDGLRAARRDPGRGQLIIDFLSEHADALSSALSPRSKHRARQDDIRPYEHPVLGLQYAPPSTLHTTRFSDPLPARLLARTFRSSREQSRGAADDVERWAQTTGSHSGGWDASVLGVVGGVQRPAGAGTEWLPRGEGTTPPHRDNDVGKGLYRPSHVQIRTDYDTVLATKRQNERTMAQVPWPYEVGLNERGGHRAVSRESTTREWERHPGVPDRPISIDLEPVDPQWEEARPRPGSVAWITGRAAPRPQRSDDKRAKFEVFGSAPHKGLPFKRIKPRGRAPPASRPIAAASTSTAAGATTSESATADGSKASGESAEDYGKWLEDLLAQWKKQGEDDKKG